LNKTHAKRYKTEQMEVAITKTELNLIWFSAIICFLCTWILWCYENNSKHGNNNNRKRTPVTLKHLQL